MIDYSERIELEEQEKMGQEQLSGLYNQKSLKQWNNISKRLVFKKQAPSKSDNCVQQKQQVMISFKSAMNQKNK